MIFLAFDKINAIMVECWAANQEFTCMHFIIVSIDNGAKKHGFANAVQQHSIILLALLFTSQVI